MHLSSTSRKVLAGVLVVILILLIYFIYEGYTRKEVYLYFPGTYKQTSNLFTSSAAPSAASDLGVPLATDSQLQDAFNNGATWCAGGWVQGSNNKLSPLYPVASSMPGCVPPGKIATKAYGSKDNLAGITVYGVKPKKGTPNIYPFNDEKWSIYGFRIQDLFSFL